MVTYRTGDLLQSDCNVICHQVNCQGVMGSGIAKSIREKYPTVYQRFLQRHKDVGSHLGDIDIIRVNGVNSDYTYIANLYSQNHYLPRIICHTDYDAFQKCLQKLKAELSGLGETCFPNIKFKIGFPDHIGCGLAGGNWNTVQKIIEEEFRDSQWEVEVWKLN